MIKVLILSSLLLNSIIAHAHVDILYGKEAADGEFSNVISIQRSNGDHMCTGTLIHPNWILTSAHCLILVKTQNLQIFIGNNVKIPAAHTYKVKRGITYANKWEFNDVALLELVDPILEVPTVKLIDDEEVLQKIKGIQTQTIVGFGYNSLDKKGIGIKRYADAKVFGLGPHIGYIGNFMDPQNPAAFGGDSGGPSFAKDTDQSLIQVGITTGHYWQVSDHIAYELPHAYLCWMEKIMNENLNHKFDCSDSKSQRSVTSQSLEFNYSY